MKKEIAKPIIKWAGGKTQMLDVLHDRMPSHYNKYIEPFIGGGALFFSEEPEHAIISDSNEELINLYSVVSSDVESLIKELNHFFYDKDMFYEVRAQNIANLSRVQQAARTIYLNKTGFNGLYRVNKKGEFNVPFGRYKNPKILDADNLRLASKKLQQTTILSGDYLDILHQYAEQGDFIFLDPPYIPVSEYADFKRYTKEQFKIEDQEKLANEVKRLSNLGCYVMLTNSNHPLVSQLYGEFNIELVPTKRMINSKSNRRIGQDVIVTTYHSKSISIEPTNIPKQNDLFPSTRYMGSKEKLLPYIASAANDFEYDSVLDLFSGSGAVSYLFKTLNKSVFTNDYMKFSSNFTRATVENNNITVSDSDIDLLINTIPSQLDTFVQDTFKDLYFSDDDNYFIDLIRTNRYLISDKYKLSVIDAALARACMKRRPRGIFTYTGNKYDDGRRDLQLSLKKHFLNAITEFNEAVFDNGKKNYSYNGPRIKSVQVK